MRSFYDYILSQKQARINTARSRLCEAIAQDSQFPKHDSSYHHISSYLEDYGDYVETMDVFDLLWEDYLIATKQTDSKY